MFCSTVTVLIMSCPSKRTSRNDLVPLSYTTILSGLYAVRSTIARGLKTTYTVYFVMRFSPPSHKNRESFNEFVQNFLAPAIALVLHNNPFFRIPPPLLAQS